LNQRLGAANLVHEEPRIETLADKCVLALKCPSSNLPALPKDGSTEQPHIRTGEATMKLKPSAAQEQLKHKL